MSILHKNICCGCSLELSWRDDSNEYPQHMFLWSNKQNYPLSPNTLLIFLSVLLSGSKEYLHTERNKYNRIVLFMNLIHFNYQLPLTTRWQIKHFMVLQIAIFDTKIDCFLPRKNHLDQKKKKMSRFWKPYGPNFFGAYYKFV